MDDAIDAEISKAEVQLRLESRMQPMNALRMYPVIPGVFNRMNQKNEHPDVRLLSTTAPGAYT
jgi:hypothetical protein